MLPAVEPDGEVALDPAVVPEVDVPVVPVVLVPLVVEVPLPAPELIVALASMYEPLRAAPVVADPELDVPEVPADDPLPPPWRQPVTVTVPDDVLRAESLC
jgi:hypothetical protein